MKLIHYVNCHDEDVYVNTKYIQKIRGKEIILEDGEIIALTSSEMERLIEKMFFNIIELKGEEDA